MPTYDDLRAYFDESPLLRALVATAASNPIVSGFTLDVDPVWGYCYDFENDLIDMPPLPPWFRSDRWAFEAWTAQIAWGPIGWWMSRFQGFRRRDLYATVKSWEELEQSAREWTGRRRLPVTITIVHRPLRSDIASSAADTEALRGLVSTVRQAEVFARIQERPRARFAFAAGDAITTSAGKNGTIGGVLVDKTGGTQYGVTCAHVASAGDIVFDSSGAVIGKCRADTARLPLPVPMKCDPISLAAPNPMPGNGPTVNMLDCALIECVRGGSLTAPASSGVARTLSPGQNVILNAPMTRKTRHKLGALTIGYEFIEGNQDFCFRDAIELLPQPRGPIGGLIGAAFATVPVQGDSGGWVLTDDAAAQWAGLFFGEDGHRGFLIRAAWAFDWAQTAVHRALSF